MKKKFNDRKSVRTLAVIRNGTSGPSQLIEPKDKNAGDEQPDPQVCPATDISPLIVKTGNKGGPNRETTAPVTPISSKRVRKRPKPRKYGQHDTGNADRLIDAHGEELIFCEQRGGFFVWIGRRWEFDGFIRTELLAERTMRAAFGEAASIEDDDSRNQFLRFVKYSLSRSGIANRFTARNARQRGSE